MLSPLDTGGTGKPSSSDVMAYRQLTALAVCQIVVPVVLIIYEVIKKATSVRLFPLIADALLRRVV
ncbi:hypothetical protein ACT7BJ_001908 [Cronobacter turicensis]|nr:hypothetical protein [Cronobacter turicensis]